MTSLPGLIQAFFSERLCTQMKASPNTIAGYRDTFRMFHPDEIGQYSWWSYRFSARKKNIGWRIDYVCISPALRPRLKDAFIWPHVTGSDHCPVGVVLE